MMEEASAFGKRLKACEKQIKQLQSAAEGMVTKAEEAMSGPFPQVWELDLAGSPKPTAEFQEETFLLRRGIKKPTLEALKKHTLDPIDAWQHALSVAKARMKEVAAAQLDLDAARRAFYKDQARLIKVNTRQTDNAHAVMPTEGNDPRLTAARLKADSLEAAVHQELIQLVRATRHVHLYLTAAMHLEGQALSEAAHATVLALQEDRQRRGLALPPPTVIEIGPPTPLQLPTAVPAAAPVVAAASVPAAQPVAAAPVAQPAAKPAAVQNAAQAPAPVARVAAAGVAAPIAAAAAAATSTMASPPARLHVPQQPQAPKGPVTATSGEDQRSALPPTTPATQAPPRQTAASPVTPLPAAPAPHMAVDQFATNGPTVYGTTSTVTGQEAAQRDKELLLPLDTQPDYPELVLDEYPRVPSHHLPAEDDYPAAPTHAIHHRAGEAAAEEVTQEMLAAAALMVHAMHKQEDVANGHHPELARSMTAV